MLTIFRRNRKNLLSEGKTGRYFKYAIGEIALVVIGILIALQINNWNEERKRFHQENKILLSLKSDFLESKVRLSETMNSQNNVLRTSSALIQIHEGKIPMPISDSIKVYVQFGAFSWYRAELITGAYDALINTGNSDIIRNDKLIKMLAEYFSILNSGFEDQQTSMNLLNNMQIIAEPALLALSVPRLREEIGLDTDPHLNEDQAIKFLFEQDAFFGHLYNKTIIEKLRYDIQKDLLKRLNEILATVDEELSD